MTPRLPPWIGLLAAAVLASALALASPAAAAVDEAPLVAPVSPLRAEALADLPKDPWDAGHRGVDLEAVPAQEVVAPGAGIVTFAGVVVDRPVLTVTLASGRRSSVEPVLATVEVGQQVTRGQRIGTVAPVAGHCAPRTCVHWGVREGDRYLDPLDLLAGFGPIRLLEVS